MVAATGCSDSSQMDSSFSTLTKLPSATDLHDGASTRPHASATECADPNGCFTRSRRIGTFPLEVAPEASGLALSRIDPSVLWLVDDEPGTDHVIALRRDGTVLARVRIEGMQAVNIEALAAGPCDHDGAGHCLYVGDIGDNRRSREDVRVYRITEPDLHAQIPNQPVAAEVIRLRYPDAVHDAEAMVVDRHGVPFILTKAAFDAASGVTQPTELFAAPGFRSGPLVRVGSLQLPDPPTAVATLLYGNTVTDAAMVDGKVLLRTYDQAVEFIAPRADADLATLQQWRVRQVPAPWQPQAEAVTYAADGCGYYLVSEKSGDIWAVSCQ